MASSCCLTRTWVASDEMPRSYVRVVMAMRQPSFISPMRFCLDTRTLSKKVSLNSELPVICFRGRTVTPGLCMSTSR